MAMLPALLPAKEWVSGATSTILFIMFFQFGALLRIMLARQAFLFSDFF
jgi:hypothetical protein